VCCACSVWIYECIYRLLHCPVFIIAIRLADDVMFYQLWSLTFKCRRKLVQCHTYHSSSLWLSAGDCNESRNLIAEMSPAGVRSRHQVQVQVPVTVTSPCMVYYASCASVRWIEQADAMLCDYSAFACAMQLLPQLKSPTDLRDWLENALTDRLTAVPWKTGKPLTRNVKVVSISQTLFAEYKPSFYFPVFRRNIVILT